MTATPSINSSVLRIISGRIVLHNWAHTSPVGWRSRVTRSTMGTTTRAATMTGRVDHNKRRAALARRALTVEREEESSLLTGNRRAPLASPRQPGSARIRQGASGRPSRGQTLR